MTQGAGQSPPVRNRQMKPADMDKGRDGWQAAAIDGKLGSCWFCGRAVSPRALFCHNCGSIQPPTLLDPFARLGLPRQYDIDQDELARRFAGFQRILRPERFANRGPREKSIAEQHRTVLSEAHDIVMDPLRRALWLLEQAGQPMPTSVLAPPFAQEIDLAGSVEVLDGIARRITQEQEAGIRGLSAAFRNADLDRAMEQAAILVRLSAAGAQVRRRRDEVAGAKPGG